MHYYTSHLGETLTPEDNREDRIINPACRPHPQSKPLPKIAALTLAALILTHPAQAQQLSRRLILKDGSYQSSRSMKSKATASDTTAPNAGLGGTAFFAGGLASHGEIRERSRRRARAFPKPPSSTRKAMRIAKPKRSRLPQVAPGLRLPELSGMFLLDNFKGQPQLVEVSRDEGDVDNGSESRHLSRRHHSRSGHQANHRTRRRPRHCLLSRRRAIRSTSISNDEDDSSAAATKPSAAPVTAQPRHPATTAQAPATTRTSHRSLRPLSHRPPEGKKRQTHRRRCQTRPQRQSKPGTEFSEDHHRPRRHRLAQTNSHGRPRPRRIRHRRDPRE